MTSTNLGSAHGRIDLDVSGVKKGTAQAQSALRGLQSVAGGIFAGLGLGAAAGFGAIVKTAVDMNATLETTQLQFETLMGSADEAAAHVASLFEIAKATPFETGPIIEASKFLQTFGGDALNTRDNILLIGDAAAATNAPIEDLGFWVGRLYSNLEAGQPFGEAAMRLQELAVMSPKARQEMEALQDGGASAAEIFAVFEKDLGRFTGAMEKQAGTWRGLTSTISDSVKLALSDGLQPFFEGAKAGLEQVAAALSDPKTTEGIARFARELGNITAKVLPLAVEHGPMLLKVLASLAAVFGALAVVGKVVGLVTKLGAALSGASAAFSAAGGGIAGLVAGLGKLSTVVAGASAAFTTAGGGIAGVVAALGGPVTIAIGAVIGLMALLAVAWKRDWGGIQEKTRDAIEYIRGVVEKGLDALRDFWDKHGAGIVRAVSKLWAAIKTYFQTGWEQLKTWFRIFKALFTGDWEELGRQVRHLWEVTIEGLKKTLDNLWEAIRPALESLGRQIGEWWRGIDWAALGKHAANEIVRGITGANIGERIDWRTMFENSLTRANPSVIIARKLWDMADDLFKVGQDLGRSFVEGWKAGGLAEGEIFSPEAVRAAAEQAAALAEIQAAAESADRVLIQNAQTYEYVGAAAENTARVISRSLIVQLRLSTDNMKLAADRTNKFGAALDGLTAKARASIDALARSRSEAEAYSAAFSDVQGDFAAELPGADQPLVREARTVTTVTGGPTAEQTALMTTYQEKIKAIQDDLFELTNGIDTFGLSQEEINKKLEEGNAEIAHYQALLEPLAAVTGDVSTSQQGLAVNVDAAHQAVYDQLVQMGAAPEIITAYAAATGIMSEAQAEAALKAALVKQEIDRLATAISEGLPIEQALADLDAFISKIETGVTPATETMATAVPQNVIDMKDAMAEEAMLAGQAVPTNIESGIRETEAPLTTALTTDLPQHVIDMKDAMAEEAMLAGQAVPTNIESGIRETEDLAVTASGDAATGVHDAWDETVDAMPEVGEAIITGVTAGLEANRGTLVAKMQEIARAAYEAAMAELQAASPSRLFMRMGEAIIAGIVAGLDAEKDTLYGKLAEVADTLRGIGDAVFGRQADILDTAISGASGQLDDALSHLAGFWSDTVIDNLKAADPAARAEMLRGLRLDFNYANNPEAARRLDEAVRLADERNRLEQEYIRQQEQLARIEEQRARLDFLKTQIDLLELIRDNGLDASILDGLKLGLNANMTDILDAMSAAVEALITRTNDELGIASPSTVFTDIGAKVMDGLAAGFRQTAGAEARLRDSLRRMSRLGLADSGRLEAQLRGTLSRPLRLDTAGLNLEQRVVIYGGYNPVVAGGAATVDPLRSLYYKGQMYQK